MAQPLFDEVALGVELPSFRIMPSTVQLMRYCAVTWNMHRVHFDPEHAASEGYPGVLVQSHLHQAFLTKLCTDWMGPRGRLRTLTSTVRRFATPADELEIRGRIVALVAGENETGLVTVDLQEVRLTDGEICAPGQANIELPRSQA